LANPRGGVRGNPREPNQDSRLWRHARSRYDAHRGTACGRGRK
jgi:hypothetical protein